MPGGKVGVGRDHPELLLAGEGALALRIPAVVELALVLVRPLLRHMVRCVRRTRREVDEERLVRHQRLLLADPAHTVVREILGEVVALLRRRRRLDRCRAVVQRRIPLVVLAADESVELLEPATARRPRVERPHRRRLPDRHLVTLAELCRRVAVQLQRHRQRCLGVRTQRALAGSRGRRLGDVAHPHRVVVASGQQRLARRRAQRRRVEPVEAQPAGGQPFGGWCVARTAERARGAEADVVDQHDEHVRRPLRRQQRLDRRIRSLRVLGVIRRQTRRRPVTSGSTTSCSIGQTSAFSSTRSRSFARSPRARSWKRSADRPSPQPSFGYSRTCRHTSRSARSGSGCSSHAIPSALRSARSIGNWASRHATTRWSKRRRSVCSAGSRHHPPDWGSKALLVS